MSNNQIRTNFYCKELFIPVKIAKDLISYFSDEERVQALQKAKISETSKTETYSHNAFLNSLCLNHILEFLTEQLELDGDISLWKPEELLSMWQFINGTAIEIGKRRLVIIPSDCIDSDEMVVDRELVDISGWEADYYLALQVYFDNNCINTYGWTTHKQLKENAELDINFKNYTIDANDLIFDIAILQIELEKQIQEKAPININFSSLLPSFKVESIINNDVGVRMSRLLVSFEKWGAIWANDELRHQLYKFLPNQQILEISAAAQIVSIHDSETTLEKRLLVSRIFCTGSKIKNEALLHKGFRKPKFGARINKDTNKRLVHLIRWLQEEASDMVEDTWQTLENLIHIQNLEIPATLSEPGESEQKSPEISEEVNVEKCLLIRDLGIDLNDNPLVLKISIKPEPHKKYNLRVRVNPFGMEILPPNLKLTIFDDDKGEVFKEIISRSNDEYIQYQFTGETGECFSVMVSLDEARITEYFII